MACRNTSGIERQTVRQQAQANSRNFRWLDLPGSSSSIGSGSVAANHSASVMAHPFGGRLTGKEAARTLEIRQQPYPNTLHPNDGRG
jgi:hypothetical protein